MHIKSPRCFLYLGFLALLAILPCSAQDPCDFGSENVFDTLEKSLKEAKSCDAAAKILSECRFGSSADAQLSTIVIEKCESAFVKELSPAGQKHYGQEMQLCAYEYAQQEGTLYISEAAACQVGVAKRFAANPAEAEKPVPRASFDCVRAQSALEKAICSDIRVGHADVVLSRVYSGILKASDEKDKAILVNSEKQWLHDLSTRCHVSGPPFTRKALDCLRNEFETRFGRLDSCQEGIANCIGDEEPPRNVEPPEPTPRASFDCEAPSSALEIVICADADLGKLDIQLAQEYGEANKTMGPTQHQELVKSERQWLHYVTASCPLGVIGGIPFLMARACVRSAYQVRIKQLQTCPQKEVRGRMACLNDFQVMEKSEDRP